MGMGLFGFVEMLLVDQFFVGIFASADLAQRCVCHDGILL
jgi:hypothetical protein